jgi:hypothetical protein
MPRDRLAEPIVHRPDIAHHWMDPDRIAMMLSSLKPTSRRPPGWRWSLDQGHCVVGWWRPTGSIQPLTGSGHHQVDQALHQATLLKPMGWMKRRATSDEEADRHLAVVDIKPLLSGWGRTPSIEVGPPGWSRATRKPVRRHHIAGDEQRAGAIVPWLPQLALPLSSAKCRSHRLLGLSLGSSEFCHWRMV